jgi:hypothetical protein
MGTGTIERSTVLNANSITLRQEARGAKCLAGGSKAYRSIVDVIIDLALCIECIIRKTNLAREATDGELVELARHFTIRREGDCEECSRPTIVFRLA